METSISAASSATVLSNQGDRSAIISGAIEMAMNAAYGVRQNNEQEITHALGELVKSRLLSAEDSYRLRDQLSDSKSLETLIDRKIDNSLKRRGIA